MLKVENWSFGYTWPLFENLSFHIPDGEMIWIKGDNGVGKSTLLSLLAGSVGPRGPVWIDGQLVEDLRPFMEYLPAEGNALFGKLDAYENLSFWAALRNPHFNPDDIYQALERWGLGGKILRGFPVERFSTGMKRRLALIRVGLSATRYWLLDEPIYGLDAKGCQILGAMMQEHLQAGGAILLVSHDMLPFSDLSYQTLNMNEV